MKHNGHEASVRLSHSICLSGGHFITQLRQYDVLWSLWVKFDPLPSVAERWAAQCFNLRPQTTEGLCELLQMYVWICCGWNYWTHQMFILLNIKRPVSLEFLWLLFFFSKTVYLTSRIQFHFYWSDSTFTAFTAIKTWKHQKSPFHTWWLQRAVRGTATDQLTVWRSCVVLQLLTDIVWSERFNTPFIKTGNVDCFRAQPK